MARETHPKLESKLPPADSSSDFPENIYEIDNNKSQKKEFFYHKVSFNSIQIYQTMPGLSTNS
jgi:hypothetical protein